jgi:transcriptional regulator with PAS, ATPase and Fis domain
MFSPIEIPPLRERREDIPLLVGYFIDHFARKAGKSFRGISKAILDLLIAYSWPGNIRELQNVIERSVIVCETENFSVDESGLSRQPLATEANSRVDLYKNRPSQEKAIIEIALSESGDGCSGRQCGRKAGYATLHPGVEDSVTEDRQETLQNCGFF